LEPFPVVRCMSSAACVFLQRRLQASVGRFHSAVKTTHPTSGLSTATRARVSAIYQL